MKDIILHLNECLSEYHDNLLYVLIIVSIDYSTDSGKTSHPCRFSFSCDLWYMFKHELPNPVASSLRKCQDYHCLEHQSPLIWYWYQHKLLNFAGNLPKRYAKLMWVHVHILGICFLLLMAKATQLLWDVVADASYFVAVFIELTQPSFYIRRYHANINVFCRIDCRHMLCHTK